MLVLGRFPDQKILIGNDISVMVVSVRGDHVRLGIEAPRDVRIDRDEIREVVNREGEKKFHPIVREFISRERLGGGYACSIPGNQDGLYIRLADAERYVDELRASRAGS